MVTPQNPQLAATLDRAFAEPPGAPPRRTRAIVVVKDGRIIAERCAGSIGRPPKLGIRAGAVSVVDLDQDSSDVGHPG